MKSYLFLLSVVLVVGLVSSAFWGRFVFFLFILLYIVEFVFLADVDSDGDGLTDIIDNDDDNDGLLDTG